MPGGTAASQLWHYAIDCTAYTKPPGWRGLSSLRGGKLVALGEQCRLDCAIVRIAA